MAAPDYVPVADADRVRTAEFVPPARRWTTDRPGEIAGMSPPEGNQFGTTGPDQGYGLKLAKRFLDTLTLTKGEHSADAVAGCLPVALKRAALFGRAPVIFDLELAFTLFGFLGDAPDDLVSYRKPLFAEASHHYWDQRALADAVPESTLRLSPAEVRGRLSGWRDLITV